MTTPTGRPHGRRPHDSRPDLVGHRLGIARRVQAVQAALGLSTEEMAATIGVSKNTWSAAINKPGHAIDGEHLLRLIVTHRVEPTWLREGTGPMFRPPEPPATTRGIFMRGTGPGR